MKKKFARHRFIQKKEKQDSVFTGYFKPEKDKRREEFMKRIDNLKARFSVIGPENHGRTRLSKRFLYRIENV